MKRGLFLLFLYSLEVLSQTKLTNNLKFESFYFPKIKSDPANSNQKRIEKSEVSWNHNGKYFTDSASPSPLLLWELRPEYDLVKKRSQLEIREFTFNYQYQYYFVKWGPQIISFSETFGTNIMDVANPRNFDESIFGDQAQAKRSVLIYQQGLKVGQFKLKTFFAPLARHSLFPDPQSIYDPLPDNFSNDHRPPQKKYSFFKDQEFGFQTQYLFDFGLHWSFIYYDHYTRFPFYTLDQGQLILQEDKIKSYGTSYSYAFENIVLRGDVLFQPNISLPNQQLKKVSANRWQSILGADYNSSDDFTFGLQWHFDQQDNHYDFHWISTQIRKNFVAQSVELAFFVFRGVNNHDFWLRPEGNYFLTDEFKIQMYYEWIDSAKNDPLFSYQKADRFWTGLTYLF